ncbi:MAG TPA: saccharopine dehydrogenase family protein [Syntrophorhabdaceae bacterium]|nr:saccharopine dehydrogenase family protein [Syntrophorhabdaceae bacterium]HOT42387.1 saccharopine dehydrogenase family protein [Syntrophorhabdaceae bacterium]HQH43470.1 saccharopine dehydrogenase family protein [Syntrophorhabdaceae bacterium]HQK45707.1 saccharopine dehydrogenase family protein [Syntrophorhabdaceae bacterium]
MDSSKNNGRIMIIGAGGVATVAAHKCAQVPEVFKEIMVASRTLSKCESIKKDIKDRYGREIHIAQVDADNVPELTRLIESYRPFLVLNLALPYQDLHIMEACLATGVHYIDTANYEPPDEAHFEYSWQWAYNDRFREKGIMAVLGSGFDPGVTNVFAAYAQRHLFDEIHYLDILDCNAGDHGHPFATNFNPEINIREVTQTVRHWQEGRWLKTPPIIEDGSIHFSFDYPVVGKRESYLLYHEELESLVLNIKGLKRARFWMTFSENYLNHLKVLKNVGMTRIDEVDFEGTKIVPIKFLKALLPEPSSLGMRYKGKTVIGNVMTGIKDGRTITRYIYNVCNHEDAFRETGTQAIAYTTGVPAMIGAMMVFTGLWQGAGVFNIEQLEPDGFMDALNRYGLPWQVVECPPLPDNF